MKFYKKPRFKKDVIAIATTFFFILTFDGEQMLSQNILNLFWEGDHFYLSLGLAGGIGFSVGELANYFFFSPPEDLIIQTGFKIPEGAQVSQKDLEVLETRIFFSFSANIQRFASNKNFKTQVIGSDWKPFEKECKNRLLYLPLVPKEEKSKDPKVIVGFRLINKKTDWSYFAFVESSYSTPRRFEKKVLKTFESFFKDLVKVNAETSS